MTFRKRTAWSGVWCAAFFSASVLASFAQPVCAQSPLAPITGSKSGENGEAPAKAPVVDPALIDKLATPRTTVSTFLDAMADDDKRLAAACLDLSELDPETRRARGSTKAYQLKEVLDRMARINLYWIPDDADRETPYNLGDDLEGLLGERDLADARAIIVTRGTDGLWRFSDETVAAVDDLWKRWKDRPLAAGIVRGKATKTWEVWIEDLFPDALHGTTFLIPDYQWLLVVLVIFFGFVVDLAVRSFLYWLTQAWLRFHRQEEKALERKVWRPVGLLAQALVWYGATRLIGLPDVVSMILLIGLKVFAVIAAVWTVFVMIDLFGAFLIIKAKGTRTKFDDLLIPLVTKSLKSLTVLIGVLTCADAFNLPVLGLVGGLGLVGAALALASKDAVSNFFGSVTVLVDRPFEIGDWISTDGCEGMVESVGFRSTRIRTFHNSQLTVPNSRLTTAIVDNMGRRQYRRFKTTIGVQYDTTPEQMDAFCEGIRELLRRHPYTRKSAYHVYFNDFGDSSLNILLYCFFEVPEWSMELRERHRLLLDIMRLAERLGVSFAFPTRTLHLFREQHDVAAPSNLASEDAVPGMLGQRLAATIAGPLLEGDERPGKVEFTGPSEVEADERQVTDASRGAGI